MTDAANTVSYSTLTADEIVPDILDAFDRRQTVDECLRLVNGKLCCVHDPFVDDWSAAERAEVIKTMRDTAARGGLVAAALVSGKLKGFACVGADAVGARAQYLDLLELQVSADMRKLGVGRRLFSQCVDYARKKGAQALYISAHSAVETQRFYAAVDCTDAREPIAAHVSAEPCDRQLEYILQ